MFTSDLVIGDFKFWTEGNLGQDEVPSLLMPGNRVFEFTPRSWWVRDFWEERFGGNLKSQTLGPMIFGICLVILCFWMFLELIVFWYPKNTGLWFGTWILFFHILGRIRPQVTNSSFFIFFFRGVGIPPIRIEPEWQAQLAIELGVDLGLIGRLLASVGKNLRIYELGKRKLFLGHGTDDNDRLASGKLTSPAV